jgi:hypothetical protein
VTLLQAAHVEAFESKRYSLFTDEALDLEVHRPVDDLNRARVRRDLAG